MEEKASVADSFIALAIWTCQYGGLGALSRCVHRLAFHNTLGQTIALDKDPLLYCAITGSTALAVYLVQHGAQKGHTMKVASFSSAGVEGATPWRKTLKLTASNIARLAGELFFGCHRTCVRLDCSWGI